MTTRKYKLLALDMDGTLLNDNHEITFETIKWINKAMDEGIHVCLSTGRAAHSAMPYAEQLGLDTPMVTVNGSEVWKAPHELHRRTLVDPDLIRQMYELAIEKDVWFWAYTVNGLHNRDNWLEEGTDLTSIEWLKFGYNTENDELRYQILMALQDMGGLEISNSSPHNLEINPLGINKAAGINEVCQLLNIDMSEVVAVGDSLNDLAVIQAVGLGVAMGNAQEPVKESADLVVGSNNDDGIVEVIRDYILV